MNADAKILNSKIQEKHVNKDQAKILPLIAYFTLDVILGLENLKRNALKTNK
jgi:hypothetical protein